MTSEQAGRYELVVWHEPEPITVAAAETLARGEIPPHPSVADFVRDLASEHPDAEVTADGSRYATVKMAPDRADEISARVYGLARAHGLVCYDPDRRLVHNRTPTGVHPETQLHTGDGMIVTDPDLGLVRDVLGRLSVQNPFAALVLFGSGFLQVAPEPGGYELEYKDSPARRLYRTRVDDLGEVRRAFQEYASGDLAFLDRHGWEG
jgi:hypothetical protein